MLLEQRATRSYTGSFCPPCNSKWNIPKVYAIHFLSIPKYFSRCVQLFCHFLQCILSAVCVHTLQPPEAGSTLPASWTPPDRPFSHPAPSPSCLAVWRDPPLWGASEIPWLWFRKAPPDHRPWVSSFFLPRPFTHGVCQVGKIRDTGIGRKPLLKGSQYPPSPRLDCN